MLAWRDVRSESDPALAEWLAIYERSFPIEVLLSRDAITAQLEQAGLTPRGEDVFHLAAAMEGDIVVGGAMFSYLGRSSLGFISYIFAAPQARGSGVGAWIYERLTSALRADATQRGGSLEGIVFEVEREDLAGTALEREERIRRLRFFRKVGASILTGLDYLQPPLHPGEEPLPMYLMFDAAGSSSPSTSSERVLAWVADVYRVIYVQGAELSEDVIADSLRRVRESIREPVVGTRRPE